MDVTGEIAHGYMEIRYLLQEDLRATLTIASVEDRFKEDFGRGGDAPDEPYRCEDAKYIASASARCRITFERLLRVRREGQRPG